MLWGFLVHYAQKAKERDRKDQMKQFVNAMFMLMAGAVFAAPDLSVSQPVRASDGYGDVRQASLLRPSERRMGNRWLRPMPSGMSHRSPLLRKT